MIKVGALFRSITVCHFECEQDGSDATKTDRSRKQDVLKELQLLRIK